MPGTGERQLGPLGAGRFAQPLPHGGRECLVTEGKAAGVTAADRRAQAGKRPVGCSGAAQIHLGEEVLVGRVGQQPDDRRQPRRGGGHTQVEERGAAPHAQAAVHGVCSRECALRVGVQTQDAGVPQITEGPGLRVVQRGRRGGVRDECLDGVHVGRFCGHGDFPS